MPDLTHEKQVAAQAAALLVEDGQTVGLGTGSTVAPLLPALAARELSLRCVATSPATEAAALAVGLPVEPFEGIERFDIAIDGTDQVTPDRWLVKGGGGAHLREKVVATAADRFVVIGASDKPVEALQAPIPLELLAYGLAATLAALGGTLTLRDVPRSPDGGIIADYDPGDAIGDPAALAAWLDGIPGVVAHGLFAPVLVSDVLIAYGDEVRSV